MGAYIYATIQDSIKDQNITLDLQINNQRVQEIHHLSSIPRSFGLQSSGMVKIQH